ncbi:hypothetical protein B0H14DRAFT_2591036 [Mycena olivaceomarginata]|nr:hypothetical protein B0H14DRAFT_2591036 [Mycena olivaceomarginata]
MVRHVRTHIRQDLQLELMEHVTVNLSSCIISSKRQRNVFGSEQAPGESVRLSACNACESSHPASGLLKRSWDPLTCSFPSIADMADLSLDLLCTCGATAFFAQVASPVQAPLHCTVDKCAGFLALTRRAPPRGPSSLAKYGLWVRHQGSWSLVKCRAWGHTSRRPSLCLEGRDVKGGFRGGITPDNGIILGAVASFTYADKKLPSTSRHVRYYSREVPAVFPDMSPGSSEGMERGLRVLSRRVNILPRLQTVFPKVRYRLGCGDYRRTSSLSQG